jgi:hypothetical protein
MIAGFVTRQNDASTCCQMSTGPTPIRHEGVGSSAPDTTLEALSNPSLGIVDPDITRHYRRVLPEQAHRVGQSAK